MNTEEKRKFGDLEVENAALRVSIDKLERELREARNMTAQYRKWWESECQRVISIKEDVEASVNLFRRIQKRW
mgnify:FL=1